MALINITEDVVTDGDTQNELSAKSRDRDETQVALDGQVKTLAEAWNAAGKPGPESAPKKAYVVASGDVSGLKQMIRRACSLHKVAPAFFKDVKREDGNTRVKFTVQPVPPKKAKANATPDAPATETAKPKAPKR
jgi:hypothetical protein